MYAFLRPTLLFCFLLALFVPISAQTCNNYKFSNNKVFDACTDLPVLDSFLHWNYDSSTRTVDVAYRHSNVDSRRWVAWAINPTGKGMVGSQALIAFQQTNGFMKAYTSPVGSYRTTLEQGNLSFPVQNLEAEFVNNEIVIFATLGLPENLTTVTQVWQEGPLDGDTPQMHRMAAANRQSIGTVDFQTKKIGKTPSGAADPRLKRKYVHGVLNAVSWGIMMPLGAIIARHMKVIRSAPLWFYLHIACQTSGYAIGVAGWATGMKLGSSSPARNNPHRNIGITLFTLATLQVFALFLRPKPDHKYRFYWNIYHHATGYSVIILSIINVFKGIDILQPDRKWKMAYIGVIAALGALAVVLEALTWTIVIKRKQAEKNSQHDMNEVNGENGDPMAQVV